MGAMTSSPLSLVGVIVASVFSVIHGQLIKRQHAALEQLKAVAPHILKPTKTPQQLSHDRWLSITHGLMTAILVIGLIVVSVLSGVYQDKMAWSFWFDIQTHATLYDMIRYIGLFFIALAGIVFWRSHVASMRRLRYITPYWEHLPSHMTLPSCLPLLYTYRNDDSDIDSLTSDIYYIVRDPLALTNRIFAIAIVLSSCSWLLCLVCGAMGGAEQFMVVKRDMEWSLLYGPVYDIYRTSRGGQFLCTCLNHSEIKCEQSLRKKQAQLAQSLHTATATATVTVTVTVTEQQARETQEQPPAHTHPQVQVHSYEAV